MICAIDFKNKQQTFGVKNPNKEAILAFMRLHEPNGYAEDYAVDMVTGEKLPFCNNGYEVGDLFYREDTIYHFDKYNMELNAEFCETILMLTQGHNETASCVAFSETAVDDTITYDPDNPTRGISEGTLTSFLQAHPEYK